MILFFETHSIVQTLLLFKYIKKAKIIYFLKRSCPSLKYNPQAKKITEKLIHLRNRYVRIENLPSEKINEHNWMVNKKAVDVTEKLTSNIEDSAIYRSILKIIGDENIIKYYKMQLADDISARLLFFRIAKDLIEAYKDGIYLIPACNDNSWIQKELADGETLISYILPGSFIANQIKSFLWKIHAFFVFSSLPLTYVVRNLKKITLKRISRIKYDIAMPVLYGFHKGDTIIDGVKRQQDDNYLYNGQITRRHIIHIFYYWRFSPQIEKAYRNVMDEKGIPYTDRRNYKLNMRFVSICIKIQSQIIWEFLVNLFYRHEKCNYIRYSIEIIYIMLDKYREFENVDYKVELMRHDYSPRHIVETIVCNKNNKRTIGIQHGSTAGPYVFNMLCYVHFDKYCIFSERHLELHKPFWDKVNVEKTGSDYAIDHLIEISNNAPLINTIKNRIAAIYGRRKHIALILFPGPSEHNLMEKWNAIYEALYELGSINIDCNIFLRFRNTSHLENSHIKRFKTLPQVNNQFVIDHLNFTTNELISVSDLVVTSSHSSGMIDAGSVGKKVFTFDYMGTAKYCFAKYGKDIILTTKDEVLRLFENLENNFTGYDCNWDLLRKEYNYHYDGKCLNRIQDVVYSMVQGKA